MIAETGFPPLLPKWQYSPSRAPVAGLIQDINNVLSSVHGTDHSWLTTEISSCRFYMDGFGIGVMAYAWAAGGSEPSHQYKSAVALANLSLATPQIDFNRGDVEFVSVFCKGKVPCGRDSVFGTTCPFGILCKHTAPANESHE